MADPVTEQAVLDDAIWVLDHTIDAFGRLGAALNGQDLPACAATFGGWAAEMEAMVDRLRADRAT